jgi:hypothetical protein
MTMGAQGPDIVSLMLPEALRPVVIGAPIGIAGCAAVSQVRAGVLYGTGSHDPVAFISVPLFLLSVSLLASYVPLGALPRWTR